MDDVAIRPILALDTSGTGQVSVALVDAGGLLAEAVSEGRAGTVVHGLVADVLERGGVRPTDLRLIAVTRGPGSFTGVRVGLAAASGLSLASGVPAVGVEATRALAAACGRLGRVGLVLEGGQGRVFAAVHDVESPSDVKVVVEVVDSSVEEAERLVAGAEHRFLRGRPPGVDGLLARGFEACEAPLAGSVGRLGARMVGDPATLHALYARQPAIRSCDGGPIVEPAARSDASAIAALLARALPHAWSAELVEQSLDHGAVALVVRKGGALAACAIVRPLPPDAEILQVAVDPSMQRTGLGRLVLREATRECVLRGVTAVHLEVARGNEAARRLYEEAGFVEVGVRARYYKDGSDAVLLRRDLRFGPPPPAG